MSDLDPGIDIFLQPGDYWFGGADTRIRTLLGSCVAITLWNAKQRLGAMCHIMLPQRAPTKIQDGLDGRYADEAVALMLKDIKRAGCRPHDFEAKLFGGGSMLSLSAIDGILPERNIEAAKKLIHHTGWSLTAEHTGGWGSRQVRFDIATGDVWIRFTPIPGTSPSSERIDKPLSQSSQPLAQSSQPLSQNSQPLSLSSEKNKRYSYE